MGNWYKKIIKGWGTSTKKNRVYKTMVRRIIATITEEDEVLLKEAKNKRNGLHFNFTGPKCRICKEAFAPYDMYICNQCNEAIERLKNNQKQLPDEFKLSSEDYFNLL